MTLPAPYAPLVSGGEGLDQYPAEPTALARAGYHGQPGHPVLIGREHVGGVAESAIGDRGARDYLATHRTLLVECGDLATGIDVDTRSQS